MNRSVVQFKLKTGARGQALVEFVLILPLLIVLCLAFFDVGFWLFTRNSVDRAVYSAVNEAVCKGPSAFKPENFLPVLKKRVIGVNIKKDDLKISTAPTSFKGMIRLTITVSFSRKSVSLMYFLKEPVFRQQVRLSRILPLMAVVPQ